MSDKDTLYGKNLSNQNAEITEQPNANCLHAGADDSNLVQQQGQVYQQQQQFPTTTQRHSINAESPLSEFGENELVASTRYVTKWSPSLFKNSANLSCPIF